MGPVTVVGLMYCGTCLRLRPKHVHDEEMRVRCITACCPAYMRTIRLPSLLRPAMAAYALGGLPALRQVLMNHPRVTKHSSNSDPANAGTGRAWFQFVPWCPTRDAQARRVNKAPSPRYQSEKRTGTPSPGSAGRGRLLRSLAVVHAGNLWADWNEKSLHRCCCSPDYLAPFPDQEAVKSAQLIGGDRAVHEVEQELWVDRARPGFDQRRLEVKR